MTGKSARKLLADMKAKETERMNLYNEETSDGVVYNKTGGEVIENIESYEEVYQPHNTQPQATMMNNTHMDTYNSSVTYEEPKYQQPQPVEVKRMPTRSIVHKNPNNYVLKPLDIVPTTPIKIERIVDRDGYLSASVRKIEDESGISVLPFPIAQLLPQVEALQDHNIIYVKGVRCVSGKSRVVDKNRLDSYINKIADTLQRGQMFRDSLVQVVNHAGQTFETLRFNDYELAVINSKFIDFPLSVYSTDEDDVILTVGGYEI